MVFRCGKCGKRYTKYSAIQRHYASAHPGKGAKKAIPKGKQKKVYTYNGMPGRKRRRR